MYIVPFDILEKIIKTLAPHDPDLISLKACSLVCRDLHYICRRFIFSSVVLCSYDDYHRPHFPFLPWRYKGPALAFHRLLTAKPYLGEFVRELDYLAMPDELENHNALEGTLELLNGLKYVTLRCFDIPRLRWERLPLRYAFVRLLRLPTLKSLSLINFSDFIIRDLSGTNLQYLFLHNVAFSAVTQLPDKPIKIRTINVQKNSVCEFRRLMALDNQPPGPPIFNYSNIKRLWLEAPTQVELTASLQMISWCPGLISARIHNIGNGLQ
ncbi:hypothetical protein BDN70DRAFT_929563 [Pholiota conissans]|uniref:F-box domain-containing protein n=1 Tax=Pholiota conissans TaxID=109636 RepID=A0A9P5Z938_9AGAR|nr:hypothetical protein BDN70DRAFT_929563 [Pholiota conissans]